MLNMVSLNLAMKLVFWRAAMMAMNSASMMMVALEKPAKAALISAIPNTTSRRQARSGGAPKGSLSCMIRMTMRAVIANAMIIWVVIVFSLLQFLWPCFIWDDAYCTTISGLLLLLVYNMTGRETIGEGILCVAIRNVLKKYGKC